MFSLLAVEDVSLNKKPEVNVTNESVNNSSKSVRGMRPQLSLMKRKTQISEMRG